MKTNYPLRLERHDNPFFTLSDVSSFSQGFAYYHGEDYPILMHSHDFYELNVVTKGECRHYSDDTSHPAKAGDVFMIPPYTEHGYWTDDENVSLFNLIISNDILNDYKVQLNKYPGIKILFEVEPQIRQAFNDSSLNINVPQDILKDFVGDFE